MPEVHHNGSDIFWGELSPSEHVIQVYERDDVFLETLAGFVSAGLDAGDGVIVIATANHLVRLEESFWAKGLNSEDARLKGQLIALEAEDVLSQFMVDRWPNEQLFELVVRGLLARARGAGSTRHVRMFGEIVSLLWARGNEGATVRIEFLWNQLRQSEGFTLFCAYPHAGFTGTTPETITQLCALHSKVVPGTWSAAADRYAALPA